MSRDRVLPRCHVCDCHVQDGEPYEWDGTGYRHLICSLQVTL